MTLKIECVAPTRSQIGEGPVWDDGAQVLWWVDIPAGYIHRYSPATGENETFEFREPVGCLAVREAGGLALAAKSGFWFFDPETGERQAIGNPEADKPGNRSHEERWVKGALARGSTWFGPPVSGSGLSCTL